MRSVLKCLVATGENLFCLIDALDEAEDDTIMKFVEELVFHIPKSRMKFCILTRPIKCLERKPWFDYSIVLQRENQADVQKIVEFGLSRLQAAMLSLDSDDESDDDLSVTRRRASKIAPALGRQRKQLHERRKAEHQEKTELKNIRDILLLRADGVILWVALCIEELLKLVRRPIFRIHELRDKINSLPGDMTEFYKQIVQDLQSSLSEEDLIVTRETLMWVSGASELTTFHLQELWDALAVSLPHTQPIPEDEDPIVMNRIQIRTWNRFRRALQRLCGPFIEFLPHKWDKNTGIDPKGEDARSDSIVQLMHQTTKDFLGDQKAAGPLYFTREAAKRLLTDGVTNYLTLTFPHKPATYHPSRFSTPESIDVWKLCADQLVIYLKDRKLLQFALLICKKERLGVEVQVAKASRAYLLPSFESFSDILRLSSIVEDTFNKVPLSPIDDAESAVVGRLFYRATTHGLPTAVINLLEMSTFIPNWWLQCGNIVLNAAHFATLDHNLKEFGQLEPSGEITLLTSDSSWHDSSNHARANIYDRMLNRSASPPFGLLEDLPRDLEDIKLAISHIFEYKRAWGLPGVVGTIGVCALATKARSKSMTKILRNLISNGLFEVIVFGDKSILDEPVENWPVCDFFLYAFSDGFPLDKAIAYTRLREPFCLNDIRMETVFRDRRLALQVLDQLNVRSPKRLEVTRDGGPVFRAEEIAHLSYFKTQLPAGTLGNRRPKTMTSSVSVEDDGDTIVVDGRRLRKHSWRNRCTPGTATSIYISPKAVAAEEGDFSQ
jgi:hypothetical protein